MTETPNPENTALEASTRKWMRAGLILMGLFVLAFPLFRFYEPARRADARTSQEQYLAAQGSQIFADNCASCHGADGTGAVAPAIGSIEFLASVDDAQISRLLGVGVPGTEMVAYSLDFGGPLTSGQIDAVTAYLRSLEGVEFSMANWRTPLENQDLTGEELYLLACSRCHGVDMKGNAELGVKDISPGSPAQESDDVFLASRIRDGYKQMPRWGRILTEEQIAGVIGYLRYGTTPPPTTTTTTTVPGGTTIPGGDTTTTTAVRSPETDPLLAAGKVVWEETGGYGHGCQECHGLTAEGTDKAPSIRGAGRTKIATALGGGVVDMNFDTKLTSAQIDAVAAYLTWLVAHPTGV